MDNSKPTRAWTRPLLITFLFVLVFHRFWNHSIVFRDSFHFVAPYKYLIAEALRQGTIYFWQPWQFLGMPFVAEIQAGWFYPLNLIYVLLPFEPGHRLFILVHYPLAAVFMDMFLRGRGLDRYASLLGAFAFAFSGYMISQHSMVRMLIGATWVPLALYFIDRAFRERIFWALGAGAVLAIQVFGGDPLTAAITALFITLSGLYAAATSSRRGPALVSVAVAGLSSLALSAVQVLPTYEMLSLSNRSSGFSLSKSVGFLFHPGRLIELIWTTPFGTLWPENIFWADFSLVHLKSGVPPWSFTNYMGLPVLVLAIIGVVASRRRWKLWVGAGAVFFLLVSMGDMTPLYGWLFRVVPGFNLFRYPAKYMAFFSGFTAVAAALGMERVLFWMDRKPEALARGAIVYILVILAGAVVAAMTWPVLLESVGGLDPNSDHFQDALSHLISGGKQWLAVNMILAITLFVASKRFFSAKSGSLLLLAVLIIDWWMANVTSMPSGPPDIFDFRPLAAQTIHWEGRPPIGKFRIYRDMKNRRYLNTALAHYTHLERTRIWERNTLMSNLNIMEGFEGLLGYGSYEFKQGRDLLTNRMSLSVMKTFNVGYLLSHFDERPATGPEAKIVFSDRTNDLTVTRLADAWPRAYWVPSALKASDEEEAVEMMFSTDPRESVILVTDEYIDERPADDLKMVPANIVHYEPDLVEVESDVDHPGWLVLSDRHYPGWSALVDGKPAAIYKANVMVRAIKLPAGRHRVSFRFRPKSLLVGSMISIPAWIAALLCWAVAWWRRPSDTGKNIRKNDDD